MLATEEVGRWKKMFFDSVRCSSQIVKIIRMTSLFIKHIFRYFHWKFFLLEGGRLIYLFILIYTLFWFYCKDVHMFLVIFCFQLFKLRKL